MSTPGGSGTMRLLAASTLLLALPLPAQSGFEWVARPAAGSPSPRSYVAMVYDPARRESIMVGGWNRGIFFHETWLWNGFDWRQATPTRHPNLYYPASIAYDSHRQVVMLVGFGSPTGSIETWEWNGQDWTQRLPTTVPVLLFATGLAYDSARRKTVLLGGQSTWEWDGTDWAHVPTAHTPPGIAFGGQVRAMAFDAGRRETVLLTPSSTGIETWTYDGTDWERVWSGSDPATIALLVYDEAEGRILTSGHAPLNVLPREAIWVWDGASWSHRPSNRHPSAFQSSLALDSQRRALTTLGVTATTGFSAVELFLPGHASFTPFGAGCAGPAGTPELDALQGDRPWLGETFSMGLANLAPAGTTLPIGILGLSRLTDPQGIPTAVDLGPLVGSPGCLWHLDPFSFTVLGNNLGTARWDLSIPGNPALQGSFFYAQALVGSLLQPLQGARVSNPGEGVLAMEPAEAQIAETFDDDAFFDRGASAAGWGGGALVPGRLGGDGRHGSFDPTLGVQIAPDVYQWSTDDMTIPGTHTLRGQDIRVTDGRFSFSDLHLPAGVTVRFSGANPAILRVRGNARIDGLLQANAAAMTGFRARDPLSAALLPGQEGGAGGPGGGRGGQGGDRSDGNGPRVSGGVNQNDGRPGDDVRVAAGHAYASRAAGTGGTGSALFPASGRTADVTYQVIGAFSGQLGAGGGGGGGGYCAPGQPGRALRSASGSPLDLGPRALPGQAFDLFPVPAGVSSLDHYLVGGSGGGGGGSHPYLAVQGAPLDIWKAGAGGSGGGGALALRTGGNLTVTGTVEARGGEGFAFTSFDDGIPAPGGGGSGGSLLLQAIGDLTISGSLDVSGGDGSRLGTIVPMALGGDARGGSGSPGYARLEALGTLSVTGSATPVLTAPQVGAVTDTDPRSGARSLWYDSGRPSLPVYLRYEVDATIDGQAITFSDDPAFGSVPTAGSPLQLRLQGAPPDPTTGLPDPDRAGPWRTTARSLQADRAAFVRFDLTFDNATGASLRVEEVRVVFR